MRIKTITASAAVMLALTLSACSNGDSTDHQSAPATSATSSSQSVAAKSVRAGQFTGFNGKNVKGEAKVDGSQLVFTDFLSDEGPDLHVYLTNGTGESDVASGKRIDTIKFDQASQTFSLGDADTGGYSTVVIHCDKAKAVFGAASLS